MRRSCGEARAVRPLEPVLTTLLFAVDLSVDDGSRNPGPIPLLIVALLALATVLLIRNMSGRIKRLPPSFTDREQRREQEHPEADEDPEPRT